jgi:hypothetical protein
MSAGPHHNIDEVWQLEVLLCSECRKLTGEGHGVPVTYSSVGYSGPEARVCPHLTVRTAIAIIRGIKEYCSWSHR